MNEEIIIALKNGVDRGESLQTVINILINSGYDQREVEESARYVGAGVTTYLQAKPEEELTMPEKKGFFKRKTIPDEKPQYEEIKPQVQKTKPQVQEIAQVPRKSLWIKDIILVIILLILVGVLIGTIFFKEALFKLFS